MSDKRSDQEKYPGRVAHGEPVYGSPGKLIPNRGATALCGDMNIHSGHVWIESGIPVACPGIHDEVRMLDEALNDASKAVDTYVDVGEVRVIDPITGGEKGQKPERYSLIPTEPLAEIARVYDYGANKYAPNNWRKGYAWSLSLDALYRHIAAFRAGERSDPESGRQHLAHAAFHLMTLLEFDRLGLGTDDREL